MERQTLGISIPTDQHRRLKVAAAERGLTMTVLIEEALRDLLVKIQAQQPEGLPTN